MMHKHLATRELKAEILKAKNNFKTRLESKMAANKLGLAWSSMKSIISLGNLRTAARSKEGKRKGRKSSYW